MSLRSFSRIGSAVSMLSFVNLGSACSVRSMARLGSSLSVTGSVIISGTGSGTNNKPAYFQSNKFQNFIQGGVLLSYIYACLW